MENSTKSTPDMWKPCPGSLNELEMSEESIMSNYFTGNEEFFKGKGASEIYERSGDQS